MEKTCLIVYTQLISGMACSLFSSIKWNCGLSILKHRFMDVRYFVQFHYLPIFPPTTITHSSCLFIKPSFSFILFVRLARNIHNDDSFPNLLLSDRIKKQHQTPASLRYSSKLFVPQPVSQITIQKVLFSLLIKLLVSLHFYE